MFTREFGFIVSVSKDIGTGVYGFSIFLNNFMVFSLLWIDYYIYFSIIMGV